jgi:hypothetical protein
LENEFKTIFGNNNNSEEIDPNFGFNSGQSFESDIDPNNENSINSTNDSKNSNNINFESNLKF